MRRWWVNQALRISYSIEQGTASEIGVKSAGLGQIVA